MVNVRIKDLSEAASPSASEFVAIDADVGGTRKTTLSALVTAGRPLADQAEAEAGVEATKAMTPLTTKQAIEAIGDGRFASAAQGALADTALQPADIGTLVQPHDALLDSVSALSLAAGDLIKATGASDVDRLPIGSEGQVLGVVGGSLAYKSVPAVDLPDPPVANTVLARKSDNSEYEAKTFAELAGEIGEFATRAAAIASSLSVAPDYIRTAGYATAGDGGGALYKKVASEPSHAGKFSITLSDGVTVVWYQIAPEDGVYRAAAFGLVNDLSGNDGKGSGTVVGADQASALQAYFNTIPLSGTADLQNLGIVIESTVNITKDINLIGSDALIYGRGGYVNVLGTITNIGTVTAATAVGDKQIQLSSVSGLSAGDLIIIHNQVDFSFGPHRAQYHDGEYNEILSISGTTLTLKKALRGNYPAAATTKVFRQDGVKFTTKGVNYEGEAAFVLRCNKTTGCEIDAVVTGGINHALSLQNNYGTRILGGRYELFSPAASNEYGISWSNSEDGYVAPGVQCFATRHPVAMGGAVGDGAVPCRNIIVEKASLANSVDNIYAADMHGNAADCYYIECDIDGGVGLAGKNIGALRCKVNARGSIRPLNYHELAGGVCDFSGTTVTFSPSATTTSVLGVSASSLTDDIVEDFHIKANGLVVHSVPNLTAIFSFFNNAVGTVDWTAEADDLVLFGDISGITSIMLLTVANTAGHSPAPKAARWVSQCGVQTLKAPTSIFVPTFSGVWTGTRFNLTPISGSTANGEYSLQADGTLVCRHKITAGATSWTFPFAFATGKVPKLNVTCYASGIRVAGLGTVSNTSANFNIYSTSGIANDVAADITAVGSYLPV